MFTLIRAIFLAQNYISEQSAIRSNTVSTMFTLIRAIVLAQNYISEQSAIRSNTVSTILFSAVHDISRSFDFLFMTFPGVLILLRPKIPTATPFGGGGTMFTLIRAIVLAQNYISEQSAIRSNTVSTILFSAVHDISRSFDFFPTATPFGGGGTMFTLIRAIVLAQNYISEHSAIRSNTVSTILFSAVHDISRSFDFFPTATPFGGGGEQCLR